MSFKGLYLVREWYFQSYFIYEIIGVRIEQMHMNEKITCVHVRIRIQSLHESWFSLKV